MNYFRLDCQQLMYSIDHVQYSEHEEKVLLCSCNTTVLDHQETYKTPSVLPAFEFFSSLSLA